MKYQDKYSCLVPMVGETFKVSMVKGTENEICLKMTAHQGGQAVVEELLYVAAETSALPVAIHRAFSWLAEYKGIRMRGERRLPEMLRYLRWCSRDAFYREVCEDKIRRKAEELREKKVPVNWMLIDDGWLSIQDDMLCDFSPEKEKFHKGFRNMTEEIKVEGNIRWFGVWHALGGYWDGILPGILSIIW